MLLKIGSIALFIDADTYAKQAIDSKKCPQYFHIFPTLSSVPGRSSLISNLCDISLFPRRLPISVCHKVYDDYVNSCHTARSWRSTTDGAVEHGNTEKLILPAPFLGIP